MAYSKSLIQIVNLGRISYGHALQVQQKYIRHHLDNLNVQHRPIINTLILCEHPPVYTIGIRNAPYPIEEEERLKSFGAEFFRTNRGGLITFHGPGQLVCYPILNLACFKKSISWYVCQLEKTLINLCGTFGLKASTSSDTGVWVDNKKICAIGIHCGRYITSHGLALNCNTDMTWFKHIVPCGIVNKGVTSLSQELKRDVTVVEAIPPFLDAFLEEFNCTLSFSEEVKLKGLEESTKRINNQ
ncbi:putative lipoyltransferase 2, mitochondrial [Polypterus senegalus]